MLYGKHLFIIYLSRCFCLSVSEYLCMYIQSMIYIVDIQLAMWVNTLDKSFYCLCSHICSSAVYRLI